MKRLFLIAMLAVGMIATGSAQKKNVSLAKNKALSMESPDFEGAKSAIAQALEDPTTKDAADTWYVAGLVYQKIVDNDIYKSLIGGTPDPVLQGESAIKSYDYYLVAYEKDLLPNAKGKVKPKYSKAIRKAIQGFYSQMTLVNYGITTYNNQDFENAIRAFETHTNIPDLAIFGGEKIFEKDTTYYQIRYYTAVAYERSGNSDKALEIFEEIKDKGYEETYVTQHLCDMYKERKDTVGYLRALEEGYKRFPNDFFFLGNLINHMIFNGQEEEGIAYLDEAIAKDPDNAEYYNVKGSVMETLDRVEEAEKFYDQALTLDANNVKALGNKARMVYNRAYKLEDLAAATRDMKKADEIQRKALEVYKESLPYFEKAAELDPNDVENLRTLRSVYYRLMRTDKSYQSKYDKVSEQIKAL